MSTRTTIKYQRDEESGDGFHLYTDFMDECSGDGNVVHLELSGVLFSASSAGAVDVVMPRDWAEKLGLVPKATQKDTEEG